MYFNLAQKVNGLSIKATEYLLPLFEFVINSIQSLSLSKVSDGYVDIYIHRQSPTQIKTDGSLDKNTIITGFDIIDNGVGFDEANFLSFNTAYSDFKANLGCKGIGRFIALATFKEVVIESVFYDFKEKDYFFRRFSFDAKNGVNLEKFEPSAEREPRTKVSLLGYKPPYEKASKADAIAIKLLDHCLIYFITSQAPKITIYDEAVNNTINLNMVFNEKISPEDTLDEVYHENEKFDINYIKNYLPSGSHYIHYCAHGREVEKKSLSKLIPNLPRKLSAEIGEYFLSVYVSGDYLDRHVNESRSKLEIPEKSEDKELFDKLSIHELDELVSSKVSTYFQEELTQIENTNLEIWEDYVYGDGIEFRHLLKYPDLLKKNPPGSNNLQKDIILHKLNYELEQQHKTKAKKLLNLSPDLITANVQYRQELEDLVQFEQDFSKSKLASYIIHRKVILKIFEKFLEVQEDGKYKYEKDIHNIIFLRNANSDKIRYNEHNLWILDERLAYHEYISSDEQFNKIEKLESRSEDKADLLIFDKIFAYGENTTSIALFEFKRPMRQFSGTDRSLEKQILRYVEILMSSQYRNHKGRTIDISETTPKFGYIICDYGRDLEDYLRKFDGYTLTPKGNLFKYHVGLNLHIEIMGYPQLLDDAMARNRAFFRQLGINEV